MQFQAQHFLRNAIQTKNRAVTVMRLLPAAVACRKQKGMKKIYLQA